MQITCCPNPNSFHPSESRQVEEDGGDEEEEAEEDKKQQEFKEPFDPHFVRDAGDAEGADEDGGGGGNHVGEAVAELECHDGCLAREPDDVGEGRHDGHGERSLGGAGGDDDVDERLYEVHHADGDDASRLVHEGGEGVEDGVDDAPVLQYLDDAACQSHDERRGEHVFGTVEEEFDDGVRVPARRNAGKDAHGEEDGGDFGEVPAVAQDTDNQEDNGEGEHRKDEEVEGLAQPQAACQEEEDGAEGHGATGERGVPQPESSQRIEPRENRQRTRQQDVYKVCRAGHAVGDLGGCLRPTPPPVGVRAVHGRAFGVALHACGVDEHAGYQHACKHCPAKYAVAHPGKEGQVGQALCDADGEGVEDGARKADVSGDVDHAQPGDGVVAH